MAMFGSSPSPPKGASIWELIAATEAKPPKDLSETIADLLRLAPPAPTPPPNPFYDVLANALNQRRNRLAALDAYGVFAQAPVRQIVPPLPVAPEVRRYVFFSFHFGEDTLRASIVRNSWRFRRKGDPPFANFHDKSLWEKFERANPEALRRLIIRGMRESSVTCVLAGTHTWWRPWVRFEIAHSLRRSNGLFTAHIHSVPDATFGPAPAGHNPLDYMGLVPRRDRRADVWERVAEGWQPFELMKAPVPWPRWLPRVSEGYVQPLSAGAPAYDYVLHNGYENLCRWAQAAAAAVGRR